MDLPTHSLSGLRPVRTILGFKATVMAARLGITVTTYNRFERGERRTYFDQVLTLAKMLDVPIEMLTRDPTPDERAQLFQRRNHHDEQERELQIEREHEAAEEVQHDLADHGFVTSVTDEAQDGSSAGTVVTAGAHDQPNHDPDKNQRREQMIADWGGEPDDE